jgi:hypothetical protein
MVYCFLCMDGGSLAARLSPLEKCARRSRPPAINIHPRTLVHPGRRSPVIGWDSLSLSQLCHACHTPGQAIGAGACHAARLVLLVGGLVHDIDHNGLNNNFHINSQSPLAVLYNDSSVLER